MIDRVAAVLSTCGSNYPRLVRTELYNEGWMIRLIMDWFSRAPYGNHPLAFAPGSRWFSEGNLPTHFAARHRGDELAEDRTQADGLVGHFVVGQTARNDILLEPDATHFMVLEGKMFSPPSPGTKNAPYYDQATRIVASIAELLCLAGRQPREMARLGYFLIAPAEQLARPPLAMQLDKDRIQAKVAQRLEDYNGAQDHWLRRWFLPTLEYIQLAVMSWEDVIDFIERQDPTAAWGLEEFYQTCLQHNRRPLKE